METDHLNSQLPQEPPGSLKFYSGWYFGSSLRLEWDGTNLYRQSQDSGGAEPLQCPWVCLRPPSVQVWADLSQKLDELGAWKWPRKSDNPDVMDGWQWDLGLVWGTRKWSGCGSNASPLGFKQVERALERLAKGRKAPGFPSGFVVDARGEQIKVRFEWNGRRLQWWYRAAGKADSSEGARTGIPSVAWRGFTRALSNARRIGLPERRTMEGYPNDLCDYSKSCFDLDMRDQAMAPWHRVVQELASLSGSLDQN